MRLALAMGRTVAELRETMDADEWSKWLLFHSLYDLPDGFLVAGRICELVSHGLGGKGLAEDFVPYFRRDAGSTPLAQSQAPPQRPAQGGAGVKPFYDFLSGYAKERAREGKPIPRERRR